MASEAGERLKQKFIDAHRNNPKLQHLPLPGEGKKRDQSEDWAELRAWAKRMDKRREELRIEQEEAVLAEKKDIPNNETDSLSE